MADKRIAVIIGAGPGGLTAAYELLKRTDIVPIVIEREDFIGGISRTVNYKGNRMDIGGHRFFSKSDRVMDWWLHVLPLEPGADSSEVMSQAAQQRPAASTSPCPGAPTADSVMLVRQRQSRIYFLRRFFTYPITLSADTIRKLGLWRVFKIGLSYMRSVVFPIRNEKNLEEFFVNRFGRELYQTFFKSYTEKVWGVPCQNISAEWGKQRIKGLSIIRTITHMLKKILDSKPKGIAQKEVETSLIEKFFYPKFGPGQMWEEVARRIQEMGGRVIHHLDVDAITVRDGHVDAIETRHVHTGQRETFHADFFFSTMPVRDLIRALGPKVPQDVRRVAEGLVYRDFITVGLLLKELKIKETGGNGNRLLKDNWIYIQEPDVLVGRLQIFNNWSPHLVADPNNVWVGMEYFCYETDDLWRLPDADMIRLATEELAKIGIIEPTACLDATLIRVPKTYPAYFGTYEEFSIIRSYTDLLDNLFLIGRNGMHRYNNQDHSMLTAMVAVDNLAAGTTDKANIWDVNTEQEYHEQKK